MVRNEQIMAKRITFIDKEGVKHVDQPLSSILNIVDRKLYDLVQVDSSQGLPICKLMSKNALFKKNLAAEEALVKQRLKNREKEIRFGTSMANHDYGIRLDQVKEKLEKAYRVRVVVEPKGVVNRTPIAKEQLWKKILNDLSAEYGKNLTIVSSPQLEFHVLSATVSLANAQPTLVKANKTDHY